MNYLIYPNGINGITGNYLDYPEPLENLLDTTLYKNFNNHKFLDNQNDCVKHQRLLGLPFNINPSDIQRSGWGIVFPTTIATEIKEALKPLINHRRRYIPPDRCKILDYKEGEDVKVWLKRHNVSPGNIYPTKIPFYLLLIGHPTEIPFEFQYLLSIEYAVGRLSFDEPEDYLQYARSLCSYENNSVKNRREVVYWAPRHDKATELSTDFLVTPLIEPDYNYEEKVSIAESLSYQNSCLIGESATKRNLDLVLNQANKPPTMLFTASHGVGWTAGHEMQLENQGALVCQDWKYGETFNESHYFAASDISDKAQLNGLVVFSFACYSSGTPAFDTFDSSYNLNQPSSTTARIAENSFIAALPQKILSHSNGSALAFIGHVDRAWGFSIKPPDVDRQILPFRNCIARILSGVPVGLSMRDFTERYVMLSTTLLNLLNDSETAALLTNTELLWRWIERNDAQSYIILGDPAAKVNV